MRHGQKLPEGFWALTPDVQLEVVAASETPFPKTRVWLGVVATALLGYVHTSGELEALHLGSKRTAASDPDKPN